MKHYNHFLIYSFVVFIALFSGLQIVSRDGLSIDLTSTAHAAIPVTTDSRIKTFVYSESEVFPIVVHYGYQSNIEFSKGEKIQTISMGNTYSWKITPVGRRLFIKALEGDVRTNMTLITNRRTYQFELIARDDSNMVDAELVYVVRFFYPEKRFDVPPAAKPKHIQTQRASAPIPPRAAIAPRPSFNFDYTMTGPDAIAPVKIFDDGKETFLVFPGNNQLVPQIYAYSLTGQKKRISFRRQGEYIVLGETSRRWELILGDQKVEVFNESQRAQSAYGG